MGIVINTIPKTGTKTDMPTDTDNSKAYGMLKYQNNMKVKKDTIAISIILPLM